MTDMTNILNIEPTDISGGRTEAIKDPPLLIKKPDDFTYNDYLETPNSIFKFKIPQLKAIAKRLRVHITGTKPVLISRILKYYNSIKYATHIQRIFRGHIVRISFKLRGEGYKKRKICVNESDFCTLEPLDEIPHEYFFSYSNKDIIYGFNIISLIQLLKSSNKIINPYNRDVFSTENIQSIIQLYRLILVIYPYSAEKNGVDFPLITNHHIYNIILNRQYSQNAANTRITARTYTTSSANTLGSNDLANVASSFQANAVINILRNRDINENILMPDNGEGNRHIARNNEYINMRIEKSNLLHAIREKPIHVRIRDIFMEIDLLGNYTSSSWFNDLERRDFIRLYRTLYDIWNYRAQLSSEMKRNICVLGGPFYNVPNIATVYTFDQIRESCLMVFENLVYTGIDDDHRKIGVLHGLTALTIVSVNARNAMMWLYDSVAY